MGDLAIDKIADEEMFKTRKRKKDKLLRRLSQNSLKRDIARVMEEKAIGSPTEYLATVMAGEDPRIDDTALLDLVQKIQERGLDEVPTLDEWLIIQDIIISNQRYQKILLPIEHSNKAAEILTKQLLAAQKETKQQTQVDANIKVGKLTKKEVRKFKKIFEEDY